MILLSSNYNDVDINDLANTILQIELKFRYCGVESIDILSVLVRNDNDLNKLIRGVNISQKLFPDLKLIPYLKNQN